MKDGSAEDAIERIAEALKQMAPSFKKSSFKKDALDGIQTLELNDRVRHLINILHRYLPTDFEETADILICLKSNWNPGDPDDNLSGFAAWPIIDYVGEYGLQHPSTSLDVLQELTSLFSAEFSIRSFYIEHMEATLKRAEAWCRDSDEHVRRLASEGCRPRLPLSLIHI